MSTTAIVVIVVVVLVAAALVVGLMTAQRRRRLQQRFGPEYDRLVDEHDSKRKAEAELTQREKRVRDLDIRPLTDSARARYAAQWADIQEQFVDMPADAVSASQVLVSTVMAERGYPTDDRDQVLADLSVEHASTLEHYRAAEQISAAGTDGSASTEALRKAMIHYRALFRDLLGEPAQEPAVTAEDPVVAADEPIAADEPVAADDPVAADETVAADEPVAADDPVVADDSVAAEDPVVAGPPVNEADAPADDIAGPAVTTEDPLDDSDAHIPAQRTPRS